MNYILIDLEFNQGYNFTETNKQTINPKCPFEIIQIGAVKLDENLQTISTFNSLVKPKLYAKIHPFVQKITGITIEKLNSANSFKQCYDEFIQLIDNESVLCTWGMADMKELLRNIEYHELDTSIIPKKYINVQRHASIHLNCTKGTNIGLSKAVELLNIPVKNQFHDAFNDAYYTAEVFKNIYTKNIKPKVYNSNKGRNPNAHNNRNGKPDFSNLIKQFEKMFNREMTLEEQSIIKLAYIMGKTNQFQIQTPDNSKG